MILPPLYLQAFAFVWRRLLHISNEVVVVVVGGEGGVGGGVKITLV